MGVIVSGISHLRRRFSNFIVFQTNVCICSRDIMHASSQTYEGRSICNENSRVNPKVLYLQTS